MNIDIKLVAKLESQWSRLQHILMCLKTGSWQLCDKVWKCVFCKSLPVLLTPHMPAHAFSVLASVCLETQANYGFVPLSHSDTKQAQFVV